MCGIVCDVCLQQEILVRSSSRPRCRASAAAFLSGLLPGLTPPSLTVTDRLLRYHAGCERYQQEVEAGLASLEQVELFTASGEFRQMLAVMGARVGVVLTAQQAELVWRICG